MRREVDEAMRATTETLSQMTNLLAVVSAPSINTATIRHIEVLALQPQVVLVVIITSTGERLEDARDVRARRRSGSASWAGEYLNERLVGSSWARACSSSAWSIPALPRRELAFLDRFAPAFGELAYEGEDDALRGGDGAAVRGRPHRGRHRRSTS